MDEQDLEKQPSNELLFNMADEIEQLKYQLDEEKRKSLKQWRRAVVAEEANTAMREYLLNLWNRTPYGVYQEEIDSLLSRYPKEGDTTCETDTARR